MPESGGEVVAVHGGVSDAKSVTRKDMDLDLSGQAGLAVLHEELIPTVNTLLGDRHTVVAEASRVISSSWPRQIVWSWSKHRCCLAWFRELTAY